MKYTITINQVGIVRAGLHTKTKPVHWAVIEYINDFLSSSKKKILLINEEELVWINYSHLSNALPFFSQLKHIPNISRIFKELKDLKLIVTKKKGDDLYVRLTDLTLSIKYFKETEQDKNRYQKDNSTVIKKITYKSTSNKSTNISKDIYKDSIESQSIFKSPFIKKCITDWNSLPFTQNIRITSKTKTIQRIEIYINQLLNGSFMSSRGSKTFDIDWFKDNKLKLSLKKLTKKQILVGIKNTALYGKEGYFPQNKNHMPKDLSTLMYNPRTGKSWFLKALRYPPEPLLKERPITIPNLEIYTYLITILDGRFDKNKMTDKIKLCNGIKTFMDFHENVPKVTRNVPKIRMEMGTPLRLCRRYLEFLKDEDWLGAINLSILNTDNKLWRRFIKGKEEDYQGYKLQ